MIRPVLKMGDALLLQKSKPVMPHEFASEPLKTLIQDLYETMLNANGIGIAAPQIGVLKQIILIEYTDDNPRYKDMGHQPFTVVINPKVIPVGETTSLFEEGCLSVPNLKGEVERVKAIKYEYFDLYGNKIVGESDSFFARVMQHEYDHLNGILYPMRMKDISKLKFIV